MNAHRMRCVCMLAAIAIALAAHAIEAANKSEPNAIRYCRFQKGDVIAYGEVVDDRVWQLEGNLFGSHKRTKTSFSLSEVTLLVPTEPAHVFAMAGNYKSHLAGEDETITTITTVTTLTTNNKTGEVTSESNTTTESRSSREVPEKFRTPQPFFKSISSLQRHEGEIVLPKGAGVVHYEAEMVVVIGREAKNVSPAEALDYVFGVTCGHDVSARVWQKGDVQWWRAKASDTFGPCGPFIAQGLDYDNLMLELRVNGETRQKERSDQLIHGVADTVSFLSRHVTLQPGDLIFMGTPGTTDELKPGDVVEVELEGAGVLRNKVVAGK